MRIRKRFAPSYFSSEPLSDLQLNQSLSNGNQAKPKSDQPSNPLQQPSDQNMVIIKWALHPNAAITGEQKEMESGEEEEKPSSNDIRNARILVQEVDIKVLQPSPSSDPAASYIVSLSLKMCKLQWQWKGESFFFFLIIFIFCCTGIATVSFCSNVLNYLGRISLYLCSKQLVIHSN